MLPSTPRWTFTFCMCPHFCHISKQNDEQTNTIMTRRSFCSGSIIVAACLLSLRNADAHTNLRPTQDVDVFFPEDDTTNEHNNNDGRRRLGKDKKKKQKKDKGNDDDQQSAYNVYPSVPSSTSSTGTISPYSKTATSGGGYSFTHPNLSTDGTWNVKPPPPQQQRPPSSTAGAGFSGTYTVKSISSTGTTTTTTNTSAQKGRGVSKPPSSTTDVKILRCEGGGGDDQNMNFFGTSFGQCSTADPCLAAVMPSRMAYYCPSQFRPYCGGRCYSVQSACPDRSIRDATGRRWSIDDPKWVQAERNAWGGAWPVNFALPACTHSIEG